MAAKSILVHSLCSDHSDHLILLLQVKASFGFRTKHVKLIEAVYVANVQDSERFELALQQWQSTAEGAVASTALEVRIAKWRLLHFLGR